MPKAKEAKELEEKLPKKTTEDIVVPEIAVENVPSERPNGNFGYGGTPSDNFKATRGKGVLELMSEGYGFLRANGVTPGNGDIYISQSQIRRFDIRPGDEVEGEVRPPKETERYFGLLKVEKVNGLDPEKAVKRPSFE